jgi:hypothetical protein
MSGLEARDGDRRSVASCEIVRLLSVRCIVPLRCSRANSRSTARSLLPRERYKGSVISAFERGQSQPRAMLAAGLRVGV